MPLLKNKITQLYLVVIAFLAADFYCIVAKQTLLAAALPLVLAVLLMAFYSIDKLYYLILLLVPVSLPLKEIVPGLAFDIQLPTEPLLVGLLLIVIFKIAGNRNFDRDLLRHPVSLAIWFYLFWMLITSITGTMPIVSFKFLLSKMWFIAGFYVVASQLFRRNHNDVKIFVWLYVGVFLLVIGYAVYRHVGYGLWEKDASYMVVNPFFKDHTSYGALLAMYIPFLAAFAFSGIYSLHIKMIARILLGIFLFAVVLSHTRAAWISLIGGAAVWMAIKLKLRFRPLFIAFLSVLAIALLFQVQIVTYLERNTDDSSANLTDHISSMTNISTDASNLERINRWKCAVAMFKERPFLGYGPGTYQFRYAPYQITQDRTIISTNSGDGGNAHSEYLGPLSESGVLGMLSILLIMILVIYTAVHTYSRTSDKYIKIVVLSALIGLITYFLHGFLNNYLDTDKASAPFWGFIALIVVFDIYTRKQRLEENKKG